MGELRIASLIYILCFLEPTIVCQLIFCFAQCLSFIGEFEKRAPNSLSGGVGRYGQNAICANTHFGVYCTTDVAPELQFPAMR